MNVRAIICAGLGLVVSAGFGAWWMSNDMAEIRAKREARCAALTQQLGLQTPAANGQSQLDAVRSTTAPGVTPSTPSAAQPAVAANPALAEEYAKTCSKPKSMTSGGSGVPGVGTGGANGSVQPDGSVVPGDPVAGNADPYGAEVGEMPTPDEVMPGSQTADGAMSTGGLAASDSSTSVS